MLSKIDRFKSDWQLLNDLDGFGRLEHDLCANMIHAIEWNHQQPHTHISTYSFIILHVSFPPLIAGQVRSARTASKWDHLVQKVTAFSTVILIYKSRLQQTPQKTVAL